MIFNKNSKNRKNRHSERGSAGLVAMMFLAVAALTMLTIMAKNSFRESRNLDKSRSKLHEKWQARSGVNTLAQIVAKDAPKQVDSDVLRARNLCDLSLSMPIFDADDMQGESSPAVVFSGSEMSCAGSQAQGSATSIFGVFKNWRNARVPIFEATGRDRFGLDADNIRIIQLDEIYRRTLSDSDVAYAVRYIVEAKFGNYRTRTNGEMILGTNVPTCGTSATLEVTPVTVERGNQVEMRITYSYANRLEIFNSANTLLHQEIVPEQSTPNTFVYRFSPASTDTYRVTATGSGGCQARSTSVVVTVTDPPPVCPRLIDFSASSLEINPGDSVTLSWNVQDAAVVTFEGANVAASGSQSFTLNDTRTFTLTARDSANSCPLTRQITVVVRPVPPACAFNTPQITTFTANPTSIAIGESSTLTWNINDVAASGTVRLTGANGLNQLVGNAGNFVVNPPSASGDYTYTITAVNTCPDGTVLQAQATVVISVRACPPPDITAFTVNPSTVTAGGNQQISFAWTIGGTADAVSISNGVGGGLPASGTVNVPQPNATTTYTITAVGCGQTRSAQVTVTVNICPIPIINNFTANPNSVVLNGNQTVRLSWNLSGTVDNLSLAGFGNVTGGFFDIPQPNATTDYTLTATGCSQNTSAQTRVTVTAAPVNIPRTDGGLYYYDQLGDYSTQVYTYAKGILFVSYNDTTGELIYDAQDYSYIQDGGGGPLMFNWNQGEVFYPTVVNNTDPCFQANGQPTPGCTFTRVLSPNLIAIITGGTIPIRSGRFRVMTTPGSGIPYIEFQNHDYRWGGESILHN